MPAPVLVHFVFHPGSTRARGLAARLHTALNDDPVLPGLCVPTVNVPEDGSLLPPRTYDLDEADHSAVVALADDEMMAEPDDLPDGRSNWGSFVADLHERCSSGRHRFIPVQLTANAWPLDERLSGTNFLRAFREVDDARERWLVRALVIELCRFVLQLHAGAKAPVRLFLSHAKQDIGAEPRVFDAIVEHLTTTQPVESWIDSGQIEAGSPFGEAIEEGVAGCTALLALVTRHYSGREWCRREALFAKQKQRPIVVVQALEGVDVRGFPYLGNAPVVAWSHGGAEAATTLLLKEVLRNFLAQRLLSREKEERDVILSSPPELVTVVALPPSSTVLYPDPPLGDEEVRLLAPLRHRVETPLQRKGQRRALKDWIIALSISESDDFGRVGMTKSHVDAALAEVTRHLLARGASLAYGGHLGSAGYTVLLFELVRAHQERSNVPPVERIRHYYGWPMPLTTAQRAEYRRQAKFVRTPRPDGVEDLDPDLFVPEPTAHFDASTPERRFAWARGMTVMREQQTRATHARVVLGGKSGPTITATPDGKTDSRWYSGQIPGVLEEAVLTIQAGKPLYVCGGFGGVAAVVADAICGQSREELTWAYQRQAPHAEAMRDLYAARGVELMDYPEIANLLSSTGVPGLAARNGLSAGENRELFRLRDVARIVELVLTGLSRVGRPPA